MINGRSFQYTTPDSRGTVLFNSNHTLLLTNAPADGGGTSGGTWSINPSGQLITTLTLDSGTYTMTVVSTSTYSITATETWVKPSGNGSDTIVFTGTVGS
jgi:hypothetical protein